ncbi:MAG: hypothetical protein CMP61_05230 [Flavobacteriales bacterium]|nr:hypothetical protein [Flavobacteriales bacterium]|tara:strand:+ start:3661 stop:4395 length:735 start_codon:yes stop_codon:yes gene_type:complete
MKGKVILVFIFSTCLLSLKGQETDTLFKAFKSYSHPIGCGKIKVDTVFYDNNSIKLLHFYKDESHVKTIKFYKSGKKQLESNKLNGKSDGPFIEWYESGAMRTFVFSSEGVSIGVYYYENGQVQKVYNRQNRKYIGIVREWWDNGVLKYEIDYSKKEQKVCYANKNGEVWISGTMIDGVYWSGLWKEYHPNGKIKTSGEYIPSSVDKGISIPVGTWKEFNLKGKIIKKIIYENGVVKSKKEFKN